MISTFLNITVSQDANLTIFEPPSEASIVKSSTVIYLGASALTPNKPVVSVPNNILLSIVVIQASSVFVIFKTVLPIPSPLRCAPCGKGIVLELII